MSSLSERLGIMASRQAVRREGWYRYWYWYGGGTDRSGLALGSEAPSFGRSLAPLKPSVRL